MKHNLLLAFFLTILSTAPVFSQPNENADPTVVTLRNMVVEFPDSVIHILDTTGNALPSYQANLLRGIAYNEKRMFSLVEKYAKLALNSDSIDFHPKEKLNALTLLSVAQTFFGNFQESISNSLKAIEIAQQSGNTAAEYNILTTMAKNSFVMGKRKQGYEYLDRIISSGASSTEARVLANVSAAYGVKIVELYADNRFQEGLEEGWKRMELINSIDKNGGAPEGFTDQQKAYAFARIASCAERAGKKDVAKKAYDSFMKTRYAQNPMGRAYIMDYLLDSGKWNTVLKFTAPLYPLFSNTDTINEDYRSLLISDGRAQAGLGNYRKGYELMNRASVIRDSLYLREKTTQAQELATIFALNEKEMQLASTRSALQKRHVVIMASFGIGLLLIIILALTIKVYVTSIKRQKIAARQIDELLAMHRMSIDSSNEEKENFRLFSDMQHTIVERNLFKSPDFNREGIVNATGLSRAKVAHLIEKFTGLSTNDYINKLRVEYSAQLIKEHPEWTIDAIAESCGYVRRATYYNHFNRIFGITPAQYRKEAGKPAITHPDENSKEE